MMGHGGNIYRISEELGVPGENIIDFSASINPLGIPETVIAELRKNLAFCRHYPDPECKELVSFLAKRDGAAPDSIICGNGSTELIYLVARVLHPMKILIPAPTFSEYERACRLNGKGEKESIRYLRLDKSEAFRIDPALFIPAMKGCDAAFLCNPNNPTGLSLKRQDIMMIADASKKLRCTLIVDEAFIDFRPEDSVINEVKNNPYLIVLRSMTKFYALTGLRIGYGVFPGNLIKRIKEHKEPWTVNTLAQKAGIAALKDRTYRDKTFRLINREKRFLENGFKKVGVTFYHSDANFYLLKINDAEGLCRGLRKKGILVRDCSNFRGLDSRYIRIAVKAHEENTMLLKELAETAQNNSNCHRQHKEV